MPKLLRPLKELRREYSVQVNRGRELLSRHIERGQDFSHLMDDAVRWDRECIQLVQTTFSGDTPDYDPLPALMTSGEIDQDVHAIRRDITLNLNQLEKIEDSLASAKSGCLAVF